MIEVPETIISELMTALQETFVSLWPLLFQLMILPFSFYVIKKILSLVPKR